MFQEQRLLTCWHQTEAAERRFWRSLWRGGGDAKPAAAGGGHILIVATPSRPSSTAVHAVTASAPPAPFVGPAPLSRQTATEWCNGVRTKSIERSASVRDFGCIERTFISALQLSWRLKAGNNVRSLEEYIMGKSSENALRTRTKNKFLKSVSSTSFISEKE